MISDGDEDNDLADNGELVKIVYWGEHSFGALTSTAAQ